MIGGLDVLVSTERWAETMNLGWNQMTRSKLWTSSATESMNSSMYERKPMTDSLNNKTICVFSTKIFVRV